MSNPTGETPKRKPGRPPKRLSIPGPHEGEATKEEIKAAIGEAFDRGYREGYEAAMRKQRLPLFEATRQWAFQNAADLVGFNLIQDAEHLFEQFEAGYGDERLIRSDRDLIFRAVKQRARRKKTLKEHGQELPAMARQNLAKSVSVHEDYKEAVVS
jgi:hypothetical protein